MLWKPQIHATGHCFRVIFPYLLPFPFRPVEPFSLRSCRPRLSVNGAARSIRFAPVLAVSPPFVHSGDSTPQCSRPPDLSAVRTPNRKRRKDNEHRKAGRLHTHHRQDRRRPRAGRAHLDEALERRPHRRTDHAPAAPQRRALFRHQHPHALGVGDRAGLFSARSG